MQGDVKTILVSCLTLLYRQSQLNDNSENSREVIRTLIQDISVAETGTVYSNDRELIVGLKKTVLEMCSNPNDFEYDVNDLLQRAKVICGLDDRLYAAIEQGIKPDLTEKALKKNIVAMERFIKATIREKAILDVVRKASTEFTFHRDKIKDVDQFIAEQIAQLEALQKTNSSKDASVMAELDLTDEGQLTTIFQVSKESATGQAVYKTGWKKLDRMLRGGIRPKDTAVPLALSHNYKTGFGISVFCGVAVCNKPFTKDPNKKPLLLRISFEDEVEDNIKLLYDYLKFSETGIPTEIEKTSKEDMSVYVKQMLSKNGFHTKMLRVNPSGWTYRDLFNAYLEYEAQGYQIEGLFLDYLMLMPRTGCIQGAVGADMEDMIRRVRNFCSAKGSFLFNPHQLNSNVKKMLENGMPEHLLAKNLPGKQAAKGCGTLDTELDIEIFLHKFKRGNTWWLNVALGKHRKSGVIQNDDWKNFYLPFPNTKPDKMPIPGDWAMEEEMGVYKLPPISNEVESDIFEI